MKAREIRERLKGKIDPDLLMTLEALAILIGVQAEETYKLAEIQNSTLDILMQLGATIENAANAADEIKKIRGE